MKSDFQKKGFQLVSGFLDVDDVSRLREVIERFHQQWLKANEAFYNERAVNSSSLTHSEFLSRSDKLELFSVIASNKLKQVATNIFPQPPIFMNTQLFFNPANQQQKNYWHRDPQYHLSIEEQKLALSGPEVVHFRIALRDEPGIELIAGSHKKWDTNEQLDVRLAQHGKSVSDDLIGSTTIPLKSGDLLAFSANMIHRGLYGLDRFAFDILLCERAAQLEGFINPELFPDKQLVAQLAWPEIFTFN